MLRTILNKFIGCASDAGFTSTLNFQLYGEGCSLALTKENIAPRQKPLFKVRQVKKRSHQKKKLILI